MAGCGNVCAVRATRFTHVSIHADDMEESLRFYTDVFGMRQRPEPGLRAPRGSGSRLGGQQLHLFLRDTPAPEFHHLGFDVDDFETAYRVASERGLLEARRLVARRARSFNDGSVQMYLRDPAGDLIEVNWPDVTTLDRSVVTPHGARLEDERPQSAEALRAAPLRQCLIRSARRGRAGLLTASQPILDKPLASMKQGWVLRSPGVTGFATFAASRTARNIGRGVLAVLIVFPIVWVLFIAN